MKRRMIVGMGFILLAGCLGKSGANSDAVTQRAAVRERLEQLVRLLEAGDVPGIEAALDRRMSGYQKFVEALRAEAHRVQQVRVTLKDATYRMNPQSGLISVRFEKRFVETADATPGLFEGRMSLLMHREENRWVVSGVTGDNLFGPPPAQ